MLQIGCTNRTIVADEFVVSMADEATSESPHSSCMNFSIEQHSKEILDQMNEYRQSCKLCDIVLRAEDDSVCAHRVVLSAASKYFKGMFCNNMAECELKEVPLFGVRASTLRAIVDFAYTSKVAIYTVCQKSSLLYTVCNFVSVNRFSEFLHCCKAYEICYKTHTTLPTSP